MKGEQSVVSLPPALVIMAGLPGTGKSHLVGEISRREAVEVIGSDAIRRGLFARPDYSPSEHSRVFSVAHRRTEERLREGRSVIFDATNIYEASRRSLYRIAERTGARVLDSPDDRAGGGGGHTTPGTSSRREPQGSI